MTAKRCVEYAALRVFEAAAVVLPRKGALVVGSWLGSTACALKVGRSVVLSNFGHVGLCSEDETQSRVRELYRNMGRYLMDSLRSPRKAPPYRLHGREHVEEMRRTGGVAVLAHFGNFEVLASVFGSLVDDLNVIVKAQHNPLVERWLDARRQATGVRTIYQKNAAKKAISVLRRGGILAALVDQNPGPDGTPVPFLGKEAYTVRAIAGLQERTGANAVSAYAMLGEDQVYDVVVAPLRMEPSTNGSDRVSEIQIRHNEIVGGWIRNHPEHWFGWFHRRFRPFADYSRDPRPRSSSSRH